MQTCSLCNAVSPDSAERCTECNADLKQFSTTNVALKNYQENPRIKTVRLVVAEDACPVCASKTGTYIKHETPLLPIEGCSSPNGCHCFYVPLLEELFP